MPFWGKGEGCLILFTRGRRRVSYFVHAAAGGGSIWSNVWPHLQTNMALLFDVIPVSFSFKIYFDLSFVIVCPPSVPTGSIAFLEKRIFFLISIYPLCRLMNASVNS